MGMALAGGGKLSSDADRGPARHHWRGRGRTERLGASVPARGSHRNQAPVGGRRGTARPSTSPVCIGWSTDRAAGIRAACSRRSTDVLARTGTSDARTYALP
jgi:hypothetical protein